MAAMSSVAPKPLPSGSGPERYNFTGRDCPRCYRAGTLSRPAAAYGLYECSECCARFKFIPATESDVASLQRVVEDSPWNAGARIADDHFCGCGARGYVGLCPSCQSEANRAGR